MPLGRCCGRDLDDDLGYSVVRTVKIKDGVLGLTHKLVILGASIALIVQFFAVDRVHYKTGAVVGVSRVQPLVPYREWTSEFLNISLPFCTPLSTNTLPATNSSLYKVFPHTQSYQRLGNVVASQYQCSFLDEKWMVTDPLAATTLFLPTRIKATPQTAPYCSASATHLTADGRLVSNTTANECSYATTSTTQQYIVDVEAYTLKIDHSVAVAQLGASWSKDEMVSGRLVDPAGKTVDPCNFYTTRNSSAACPINTSPLVTQSACESVVVSHSLLRPSSHPPIFPSQTFHLASATSQTLWRWGRCSRPRAWRRSTKLALRSTATRTATKA